MAKIDEVMTGLNPKADARLARDILGAVKTMRVKHAGPYEIDPKETLLGIRVHGPGGVAFYVNTPTEAKRFRNALNRAYQEGVNAKGGVA